MSSKRIKKKMEKKVNQLLAERGEPTLDERYTARRVNTGQLKQERTVEGGGGGSHGGGGGKKGSEDRQKPKG